jgi:hypothetical protein
MEDIRIARATRTNIKVLTLASGQNLILPYNPNRYALIVGNTSTGTVDITPDTAAAAGRAFRASTSSAPIIFRLVLEGDMVRFPWTATPSSVGVVVTVIETELADQ